MSNYLTKFPLFCSFFFTKKTEKSFQFFLLKEARTVVTKQSNKKIIKKIHVSFQKEMISYVFVVFFYIYFLFSFYLLFFLLRQKFSFFGIYYKIFSCLFSYFLIIKLVAVFSFFLTCFGFKKNKKKKTGLLCLLWKLFFFRVK